MITDFPVSGKAIIKASLPRPEKFELIIWIPSWSNEKTLKVNGINEMVSPGTYKKIEAEMTVLFLFILLNGKILTVNDMRKKGEAVP